MRVLPKAEFVSLVRILGRRGYHIAQCTKPGKLGESVPDFKSTPVTHEYLLHEQVEKVLFLWGGDGIDDPLEIDRRRHHFQFRYRTTQKVPQ